MENIESLNESLVGNVDQQTEVVADGNEVVNDSVKVEVAEPQKQVQTPEENSKFAEMRRQSELKIKEAIQKAKDEAISEVFKDQGIKTYSEYQEALSKKKQADEIETLMLENDIPEAVAKQLLEAKNKLKEYESKELTAKQEQEKKQQFNEFIELFPNVDANDIPSEVWEAVEKGKDLVSAYAVYSIKNIDKVKIEAEQTAIKKMRENASTATDSMQGVKEETSMNKQQVNDLLTSMSSTDRTKWISKNYDNLDKWGYFK